MFTGIIEASGTINQIESRDGDSRLIIASSDLDFSDVSLGDSIAVSGVCLTVVSFDDGSFAADVSNETLRCTSLAQLESGSQVNLEKAMRPTDRLGGHIVSGHVDGLAELVGKVSEGRSEVLTYKVPDSLARYIAAKGSVCLDGVSLTVNTVMKNKFSVNIIPHTSQQTTMQFYQNGQQVNLEVDVISRYLERLISADNQQEDELSIETLAKAGFINS